jgi:DNA-binding LacI/PurR family transcriptional regulator
MGMFANPEVYDSTRKASLARRAGFERTLADAGIASQVDLIVAGDFSYRSGLAAAEKLLVCWKRSQFHNAANFVAPCSTRGLAF